MQYAYRTILCQISYFHVFLPVDRRGQARDGIAYGPLTDLPDWSFAGKTPMDYCSLKYLKDCNLLSFTCT